MKFKIGNIINYSFFANLKIVDEYEDCFVLQDKSGNTRKYSKRLVNKYGKLVSE